LYSLVQFLAHAVVAPTFVPPDEVGEAICLTARGTQLLERMAAVAQGLPEAALRLGLFVTFGLDELLVDVSETQIAPLRRMIDNAIVGGLFRYPWRFGRGLEDAFLSESNSWVTSLPYEQAVTLLEATGKGVFQLGRSIVGPFGLLESSERRILRPARYGPTLACSDPACFGLHPVELSTGESPTFLAWRTLQGIVAGDGTDRSDWDTWYFHSLLPKYDGLDDFNTTDLPVFLGDSFSREELATLTAAIIESEGSRVRERFPDRKRFTSKLGGSATAIAERLSEPELLQLLLLADDGVIIEHLDRFIENGTIAIPPTEVRRPDFRRGPINGGQYRIIMEASSLGVRLDSERQEIAVPRLQRLIRRLYSTADDQSDLEWKLRNVAGLNVGEKLARFSRTAEPGSVLADLVLDSPAHLREAFRELRFGYFPMPSSPDEERRLIERLLWKLGFPTLSLPEYQDVFWRRIDEFHAAAEAYRPAGGELARQEVRSQSVNLFVSVEQMLDYTLSFVTWALLNDHYGAQHVDQFAYNTHAARSFMANTLNGRGGVPGSGGQAVYFDPAGRNTLDPLIRGLDLLADVCEETLRTDEAELRRPSGELPWFHERDELERFPFVHRVPLLDIDVTGAGEIVRLLRRAAGALHAENVSSVRNRIDHQRDDFPTRLEMLSVSETLRDVFGDMDVNGLIPTVFRCTRKSTDQFRRSESVLTDYRGREFILWWPEEFRRSRMPFADQTQVILHAARLPESLDVLRFGYQDASPYVARRRGLPIRVSAVGPLPTIPIDSETLDDEDRRFESEPNGGGRSPG
jgi:hypothetical protein